MILKIQKPLISSCKMKKTTTLCTNTKFSTTKRLIEASPLTLKNKTYGGLRAQGYFKSTSKLKPLLSIITVVYNGEQFLEDTIFSVLNQTYDNIEFIIIDGGSTDKTLDIVKKHEHALDFYISEKDQGIWDAMNKGIRNSKGDILYFLNSDDYLVNNDITQDIVFEFLQNPKAKIIYGKLIQFDLKHESKREIGNCLSLKQIKKGQMGAHQATFMRRECFENTLFNIKYRVVSDYDLFSRCIKKGFKYHFINKPVAVFREIGASSNIRFSDCLEGMAVVKRHFGIFNSLKYIMRSIKNYIKSYLRKILVKIGLLKFIKISKVNRKK